MADYGWQIFNENGILVADHSVIMSRRLGVHYIPFIKAQGQPWEQTIQANFNGGTPFVHCTVRTGVQIPNDAGYAISLPDIQISGNLIIMRYTTRHFSYPDDIGGALYYGNIDVNYGVYNQ